MKLELFTPTHLLYSGDITKVRAESVDGYFTMLPHHIDYAATLVPGILSFETETNEVFYAVDEGILVKCGPEVRVATYRAVGGEDLGTLRQLVSEQFEALDEHERRARRALMCLGVDFVRHFIRMEGHKRG